MGRIAGDSNEYQFRLCRMVEGVLPQATSYGFSMPSVSTFIGEVLAKPPSAMAWWGYRIGLKASVEAFNDDAAAFVDATEGVDPEDPGALLEALLKERGVNPNMKLEEAGDRGTDAHSILEIRAEGKRDEAVELATQEMIERGTQYGASAIAWFDEQVQPYIDSGEITEVVAERPVWSLRNWFCGTFDLGIKWGPHDEVVNEGWEILDAKTHKPASGFTKPGKGAGYIADATQCRAYRMAHEEMGLGRTIGQRTVVLRDRPYRGVTYLEDTREVPEEFVTLLRRAYDMRREFEKGD